jgi:glycosyltransferase involved in cell wall biosynthesis
MRVLVFSHSYVVAANHAKLEHLARIPGVELSLVCPRSVRREIGTYRVQRIEHPDYTIVPLRTVYPSHNFRFFYLTAGRAIARLAPDILHIEEEPWSLAAWQAVRHRRRRPGVKIVFFTWQNLRVRQGFPHGAIEWRVLAAADAAIAGNAEAAAILREKGFSKPIHVLPQFGVDETAYARRDEAALRQKLGLRGFVIGFAGRLVPEKGLHLVLEAVAGLADASAPEHRTPNTERPDWSLLVAGGGPLRERVAERLKSPPFAGRSVLLDTVAREAMPRYLNCMDALVLPSRAAPHWKEQFGHVLIEAMACEVPVVGSSCGEIPNVIADAGLVFPEGDVGALREALRRLMASPGERAALAARGRWRILERYTDARIAQATHEIHRQVLGQ